MKKISILLFFLTCIFNARAQDTMSIIGTKTIGPSEILSVKPGTVVSFDPGAILWIEGSLQLNGTVEKPILFISKQQANPGQGIVITGDNSKAFVQINYVNFASLTMPINFEPFWNRKEVQITQNKFSKSQGNEPILFISTPQLTQGEDLVKVILKNNYFINNQSGVLLEYVGGKGLKYEIDNLTFQENGSINQDETIGNLHLDLAKPYIQENIVIGSLAFIGGIETKTNSGVSLGGNSGKILAQNIFTNNGGRWVYDAQKDPRLGSFEATVSSLDNYPQNICYFNSIKHKPNLILATGKGNCKMNSLLDSSGLDIPFTQVKKGDSLIVQYQGNNARKIKLDNELLIPLPESEPERIDNAVFIPEKEPKQERDSIIVKAPRPFTPSFEAGIWGGIAFYVGDVKHRFGIPGLYEWSGGIYGQINKTEDWSFRLGFNRTNIGMHDPTAPLLVWRSADSYGIGPDGTPFVIPSWDMNFKTKMYILEADAIYYFSKKHNNYTAIQNQDIGHWIPAIGMGAGLMYYEPYKCVVYNTDKDTAVYVKLRDFGTEGQNYLDSKRDYGSIALNINLSFQLAYVYKNWRFRYEIKSCLSFSDYLDDMGQGYVYGGNYTDWYKSVEEIEMPIDKNTGKPVEIAAAFPNYTSSTKRTTNLLPDMFFPQHIGVSYCFGSNQKKKDKK